MSVNRTRYLIWLLLILSLVACETDVELVKMPEFKQKLVIISFISPGDSVSYITVSSNRRVFGDITNDETPGNLTAYLSDAVREIKLDTTKTGFKFFPSEMQIEDGNTYKLKVQSDKGLSAEAICTVPFRRNIEIEVDTFTTITNNPGMPQQNYQMADIFLNDYKGEDNYYRVFGEQTVYVKKYGAKPITNTFSQLGEKCISDKGRDGKKFLINTIHLTNPEVCDSTFLKLLVYFTDKAYFSFHESLSNYSNDENPFSEISPVYSNVIGGLGVFSAYTSDTVIIRLK
jgi:hypothetical protein